MLNSLNKLKSEFAEYKINAENELNNAKTAIKQEYEAKMDEMKKEYDGKLILMDIECKATIKSATKALTLVIEGKSEAISNLNRELGGLKVSLNHFSQDTADLKKDIEKCNTATKDVNIGLSTLESRAADSEDQSRRHNLKFFNIEEQTRGFEDCAAKIKAIVARTRHIEPSDVWLDRAHRLGAYNSNKTRPIIVRFTYYPDKENMLKAARALDKGTRGWGISEDYSKETYELRRELMTHLNKAKEQNDKLTGHLNYKTLVLKFVINDKLVHSRVTLTDIGKYPYDWTKPDFRDIKSKAEQSTAEKFFDSKETVTE